MSLRATAGVAAILYLRADRKLLQLNAQFEALAAITACEARLVRSSRRFAHHQFAVAIRAVIPISNACRLCSWVRTVTRTMMAMTANTVPKGIRSASACGRNRRNRIKAAHAPEYTTIFAPAPNATVHRYVPVAA